MSKKQFESDHVINEFKELFEQAFGKVKQDVTPRQKADLVAFFSQERSAE